MADSTSKRILASSFELPEQRCPLTEARDDLASAISESPAFQKVVEYLEHARSLGFDPSDLDILRRAITAGEEAHAHESEIRRARDTWADARNELTSNGVGRHRSVVYYARLGPLVKIGTTTRIIERCASLGVQGVLAVEPGDSGREHERHQEFSHLRSSGEWFQIAPDLADHIGRVREDFAKHTDMTVEAWVDRQRAASADFRARNLRKVNRTLYSGRTTSLPTGSPANTLVTGADAARLRGISPQLLNGWREKGKIRPVDTARDGRPLYRLSEIIRLDYLQRRSPMSHRHR